MTLASVVLLGLARRSGSLRALRGRWPWLALYAVVEVSIPFPLIAAGEQHISSSLAAITIATVPLLVALRIPSAGALGAVAVLGLVCTALAFALMTVLIPEIGPARAMVITYINPVIAVALGVTLLGERPGAGAVAGLLLLLAGSWLLAPRSAN